MSERLPDGVMLDDFARLLEMPEHLSGDNPADDDVWFLTLATFLDEHGARLLLLARTCHRAMERQAGRSVHGDLAGFLATLAALRSLDAEALIAGEVIERGAPATRTVACGIDKRIVP